MEISTYLKTIATNTYNSYKNLKLSYKILIPVGALVIGAGVFYGNKVIDYGSRLTKKSSIAESKSASKKTTKAVKSSLAKKTKPTIWVQRQYKVERKGDFDHNRVEDLVLKDDSGNLHVQFGWHNPYTKKAQYLSYERLRKRLNKDDRKRYDDLVSRLLKH